MKPCYTITPKGSMVLDLTERLERMLQEQREAFYLSLKGVVQRLERGDTEFQVAFFLAEALAIVGLVASGVAEDQP